MGLLFEEEAFWKLFSSFQVYVFIIIFFLTLSSYCQLPLQVSTRDMEADIMECDKVKESGDTDTCQGKDLVPNRFLLKLYIFIQVFFYLRLFSWGFSH